MNRSQKIDITISSALMIIVATLFYAVLPHALTFQHENSYFILTSDFAAEKLYAIGGLSNYIASLACTSVVVCTIFIGFVAAYMFYVLTSAGRKISGVHDPLFVAIIPISLLLVKYINVAFISLVSSALIITALLHLLLTIKGTKRRAICAPILIIVAYVAVSFSTDTMLIVLYCGIYLIYALLIVKFISKYKKAIFITAPITILISFYIFYKDYNPRLKHIMLMEQKLNEGKWQEVLELSASGIIRNKLTCYYTNIALLKTNNFSNYLFHYPQIGGIEGLSLAKYEMRMNDLIYDIIGVPSEALHSAFENYVGYGKNFYNLPKIIYYYDKVGKSELANRFVTYLPSHKRVTPTGYVSHGADSTLVGEAIINTLEAVCKADSSNRMAFECLMAHYAMSGRIIKFTDNIDRAKTFFGKTLPPYYEEIIILYKEIIPKEQQRQIDYTVSDSKIELFNRFNESARKRVASATQFGSTYWYYNKYLNPSGDKLYLD